MKAIAAIGGAFLDESTGEFDWCKEGELLCCGTNMTYAKENCFVGVDSCKATTRGVIVEIDDPAQMFQKSNWYRDKMLAHPDDFVGSVVGPAARSRYDTEMEHLLRQAQRYEVGTVVGRTADGLDIEEKELASP